MKVAIIGSGLIANTHAQIIQSLGQEVAVVINPHLAKAAAFAEQWGIPDYGTELEMALRPDIAVVHICTPPQPHAALIKAALEAGKHVLCEKPMCLEPEDAREMMELAEQKGLLGAVNFNIRFHDACQKARAFIAQESFGRVLLVHGEYLQEFHALPDTYHWRYQDAMAGKMRATTEIGSHWIDLVRYWTGLEIQAVSAEFANFHPQRHVFGGVMYGAERENATPLEVSSEDVSLIRFKFSNGAIGNVVLSEIAHGRNNQLRIQVTGTNQSVWWENEHPYQLHFGKRKHAGVTTQTNSFSGGFPNTFYGLFQEFYKAIQHPDPSQPARYPSFKDGYINAAICTAVLESANKEGAWVQISDLVTTPQP